MVKLPKYTRLVYSLPLMYEEIPKSEVRLVREQYGREQKGLCYFCKEPLSGKPSKAARHKKLNKKEYPRGFFKHKIHLHHCHNSGLTLGAVHAYCNAVLWVYYGE